MLQKKSSIEMETTKGETYLLDGELEWLLVACGIECAVGNQPCDIFIKDSQALGKINRNIWSLL